MILVYFLMWKRWATGKLKQLHIATGAALAVFSWLTMMIIVAILSFMMGTGSWTQDQSFFSAFFNELYAPQLAFRTCYAMLAAGLLVWFLTFMFTRNEPELRTRAVRFSSMWILCWTPLTVLSAFWYWGKVPAAMQANIDVGMMTQAFANWHDEFATIIGIAAGVIALVALIGLARPRLVPGVLLIVPFVIGLWMLGHFERVREFIRKPHVVADYMYSNGVTMDELPVFQRDGILQYATFVSNKRVTSDNMVSAGHDVFMIACSRCHTSTGLNGIVNKFNDLYGTDPWDENALAAFIPTMHMSRTYMPPFPGNEKEAEALVVWLREMQQARSTIYGAQSEGVPRPAAVSTSQ